MEFAYTAATGAARREGLTDPITQAAVKGLLGVSTPAVDGTDHRADDNRTTVVAAVSGYA